MWLLSTPSSSPPVQPSSISVVMPILDMRAVYLEQIRCFRAGLFRQVDHVGREQRFASSGEVFFTGVQQAVDPRQQFLRAVVSVQDNRHAVVFSHLVHVVGARDSAEDSSTLRNVSFHAFTCDERCAAVRELNDNRRANFRCSFQNGVDGISTYAVYRRQCKVVFFRYGTLSERRRQ